MAGGRDAARMSGESAEMSADDLIDFVSSVQGDAHLAIEENLGDGFVRLRTAEAERRQAKHDIRCVEDIVIEMLRNARDAHARHIYLASWREDKLRHLTFIDDGDGVPAALREAIFEPRVTSKLETMVVDRWGVHGRGMALYSIRQNTLDAHVADAREGEGSSFCVEVDTEALGERTDQSSLPKLQRDAETGQLSVESGPHNIVRTCVEFALEERDHVSVYLGTPADILAALVAQGRRQLDDEQLLFCDDVAELPVCMRPAAANDAAELCEVACGLALPISERTAHRVLGGQIAPAVAPLSKLVGTARVKEPKAGNIYKDRRGLKVGKEDLERFRRRLESSFDVLAQRYFIQLKDSPKVHVGSDAITVRFPIEKEL